MLKGDEQEYNETVTGPPSSSQKKTNINLIRLKKTHHQAQQQRKVEATKKRKTQKLPHIHK